MAESEILHRTEVRGVIFWVEKSPDGEYSAHSSSDESMFNTHGWGENEEYAVSEMQSGIELYERILEKKRKTHPTPRQLAFLFREKIPIPLTLTWGEASDLIDERLQEKTRKKQQVLEYLEKYPYADSYNIAHDCAMTFNQARAIYTQIRKEKAEALQQE